MVKKAYIPIENCNDSISTFVKVGKSASSKGWALNLKDTSKFIPIEDYQLECYIFIGGIISEARIKINPRLFYRSGALSDHLQNLADIDPNQKIPLELKFDSNALNEVIGNFSPYDLKYIDTKLLVGRSFSSKGWRLSKDVTSKLIPSEAYKDLFPIIVDNFDDYGSVDIQARLFYSSKELSYKLEKLFELDPTRKLKARIIFDEEFMYETQKYKSFEIDESKKCVKCGALFDNQFDGDKCPDCLDKEFAVLRLKDLLNFVNPNEEFFEEDLIEKGLSKRKFFMISYKLEKYHLLYKNFNGSFILKNKDILDNFISDWNL